MKTSDRRAIDHFKELATAAAFDVEHWHLLAGALREHMPEVKVFIHFTDIQTTRSAPALAAGIGDEFLRSYADYYHRINPWNDINVRSPLMAPIWTESSAATAAASIRETEFCRDFLRPIGECDAATAIKLAHDESRFAQISLHYDSRIANATHAKAAPILVALAPTLVQSFRSLRLRQMKEQKASLRIFIDTLLDPAFVLNANGKVKAVNPAAERLMRETAAIRIGSADMLQFDDAEASAFVETARLSLKATSDAPHATPRSEPLLHTPSGTFVLTALRISTNMSGCWGFGEDWARTPALLLSLRPATTDATQQKMLIRQTFALTAAEAELAILLATGLSLAKAAEHRGVTYETARWQLKGIFAKMKVNRQSELVSLLVKHIGLAPQR